MVRSVIQASGHSRRPCASVVGAGALVLDGGALVCAAVEPDVGGTGDFGVLAAVVGFGGSGVLAAVLAVGFGDAVDDEVGVLGDGGVVDAAVGLTGVVDAVGAVVEEGLDVLLGGGASTPVIDCEVVTTPACEDPESPADDFRAFDVTSQTAPTSTTTATPMTTTRRSQYTWGDRGPTGWNTN